MALNNQGYAHVTAHTIQVICRYQNELREKLLAHPEQAEIWRGLYHAYAVGAQAVWMNATSGLAHGQDAATVAQQVRIIADSE